MYFTRQLSEYFADYYRLANANKIYPAQGKVIREIRHLLTRHGFNEGQLKENKIEELEDKINKILKTSNKKAVLFVIPGSDIINCWSGDLVEEKTELKNIRGKELKYTIKVLDKLIIQDFSYFSSRGKEALDAGTRQETIYYNLEAYRIRANSIWDFFARKDKKRRRYDSSKSNRLRKKTV